MPGGKAPSPRLEASPQDVGSQACWGPARPTQATPSPLQPDQAQLTHPCRALPHHGPWPLLGSPTLGPPSLGLCPLSSMLPGFSASACPGLVTRAAGPKRAARQGAGWREAGPLVSPYPSPSAPGTTEARSPLLQQIVGPGSLPSLLPPSKAGFLTSFQALPRGTLSLKDGALAWK